MLHRAEGNGLYAFSLFIHLVSHQCIFNVQRTIWIWINATFPYNTAPSTQYFFVWIGNWTCDITVVSSFGKKKVSLCEQSIYSISIWRHHFHFMKCQVTSLFLCVIQRASCLSHFAAIHTTVLCEREWEQIEREYILACILYSWINSLWMSYIFPVCVCAFVSVCVFFDVL